MLAIALKREEDAARLVLLRAEEGDPRITDEDIQRANLTIATIPKRKKSGEAEIDERNLSPFDAYKSRINKGQDELAEEVESYFVAEIEMVQDRLSSAISKKLGIKDPFLDSLINLFIQQNLIRPFIDGLSGGGFGGGVFGAIGGLFGGGRASGGPVAPGRTYLVGERGPELVTFGASGQVHPNGAIPPNVGAVNQRVQPAQSGGRSEIVVRVEANEYFDARVEQVSGPLAYQASVRAVRAAAPEIVNQATAASPKRMQRLQTLGS